MKILTARAARHALALATFGGIMLGMPSAAQLDLNSLWDFANPALSRQRFESALATASTDDALVLRTQIARSLGLERKFDQARALLKSLEPQLTGASPAARARHALEWGRSFASAAHTPKDPQDPAAARIAFEQALQLAKTHGLDALAIDAVHMLAFVDTAPAQQLHWAQTALDLSLASTQPDARRWEASIRHNVGFALQQLQRFDEALAQFKLSEAVFLQTARPARALVARWMQGNTLRLMGQTAAALTLQTELEAKNAAADTPDVYVFDELALLHQLNGNTPEGERYRALAANLRAKKVKP